MSFCVPDNVNINNKCAPGIEQSEGSCFSIKQLEKITFKYNQLHPNDIIELPNDYDKRFLLKNLIKKMESKYGCDNEVCWLGTEVFKNINDKHLTKYTLKPQGPSDSNSWLGTFDIDSVLYSYENVFNDFKYLGTMPNDFNEIDLFGFKDKNFNKYLNSTPRMGMVINHDNHNQRGSHWVSLFIDGNRKKVYYFDSVGAEPKKEVKSFITQMVNLMNNKNYSDFSEINEKYIKINRNQHQRKNSECGVYSINFILRMLDTNSDFESISNKITSDDKIYKCRKQYFNKFQ